MPAPHGDEQAVTEANALSWQGDGGAFGAAVGAGGDTITHCRDECAPTAEMIWRDAESATHGAPDCR